MAFAFDTLSYAKRLRDAGVPSDQAEAHAEAAGEFIMAQLATQNDLAAVRSDLDTVRRELQTSIDSVRHDLEASIERVRHDLEVSIDRVRHDLEASIAGVRRDLEGKIDTQTLRLTVRLGVMLAAGLTLLAAVLKLT